MLVIFLKAIVLLDVASNCLLSLYREDMSTREEMCLITPVFYPYSNTEPSLVACVSGPITPYTFHI